MLRKIYISILLLTSIYGLGYTARITESTKWVVEHSTFSIINSNQITASTITANQGNFEQLNSTQINVNNINLNGHNYTFIPLGNNISLFYVTKDTADISDFKFIDSLNPQPESFTVVNSTSSSGSLVVQSWITPINVPNTVLIPQGIWHQHIHAQKSGFFSVFGNINLAFEGIKISSDNVITSLFVSAPSVNITGDMLEYDLSASTYDIQLSTTDRIGFRLIANCSGILGWNWVTVEGGGNTESRLDIPTILGGESIFTTINNEINNRQIGDTNLQTQIDNIVISTGSISEALNNEINNRINGDTALGIATGTIASNYVPYVGATQNVDLGSYSLTSTTMVATTALIVGQNVNVGYDINMTSSSIINIGNTTQDGTWRLKIINGELAIQELIGGVFTTQGIFTSK